jgi:hypothetical protein
MRLSRVTCRVSLSQLSQLALSRVDVVLSMQDVHGIHVTERAERHIGMA